MPSTRADTPTARTRPPAPRPVGLVAAGDVLRALADPMRAVIVELLAREQLCNCHLQTALGARQTLVSHHLRQLRQAGLVLTEAHGRFTYYRLAPGAFDATRDAFAEVAAATRSPVAQRPC